MVQVRVASSKVPLSVVWPVMFAAMGAGSLTMVSSVALGPLFVTVTV